MNPVPASARPCPLPLLSASPRPAQVSQPPRRHWSRRCSLPIEKVPLSVHARICQGLSWVCAPLVHWDCPFIPFGNCTKCGGQRGPAACPRRRADVPENGSNLKLTSLETHWRQPVPVPPSSSHGPFSLPAGSPTCSEPEFCQDDMDAAPSAQAHPRPHHPLLLEFFTKSTLLRSSHLSLSVSGASLSSPWFIITGAHNRIRLLEADSVSRWEGALLTGGARTHGSPPLLCSHM